MKVQIIFQDFLIHFNKTTITARFLDNVDQISDQGEDVRVPLALYRSRYPMGSIKE